MYNDEQCTQTDSGTSSTSRTQCSPPPDFSAPPINCRSLDFTEEIVQTLMALHPSNPAKGLELAEAFCEASDYPPITTQSLSELDIQNIITNVRLRQDVNFDRDLSFRPNLDGARGEAKQSSTETYWTALVAELELYSYLSQDAPDAKTRDTSYRAGFTSHAKRRIPIMFQTVRQVLKTLVPDRDYARVDEHLDVPMLMQEIERGVCDMVRLAEWMAQLLKEHCAPMRDVWVDDMVSMTQRGASGEGIEKIVEGLRDLFTILEIMKLVSGIQVYRPLKLTLPQDVANHQIRNLKTLLIEDTVNFQRHYHLDKLINGRSRVNIDTAQAWYLRARWEFADLHAGRPLNNTSEKLAIFVRTVVAQLFNKNGRHTFPETFYLDQDRLRTLKAEIEDLIHLEVCMDAFAAMLKQSGHDGLMSPTVRRRLHSALLAIMGDVLGYGSHQWVTNSEALSLELLRQVSYVTGQPVSYSHEHLSHANSHLLHMFHNSFQTHNPHLEDTLLDRVIMCASRNSNCSPTDLFSNLVSEARSTPPQSSHFLHLQSNDTSPSLHTMNPETAQWQDIANRITHIILLHWRVWERIAYVQDDESQQPLTTSTTSLQSQSAQSSSHTSEHDAQIVTAMRTGETSDPGPDAPVAPETSPQ